VPADVLGGVLGGVPADVPIDVPVGVPGGVPGDTLVGGKSGAAVDGWAKAPPAPVVALPPVATGVAAGTATCPGVPTVGFGEWTGLVIAGFAAGELAAAGFGATGFDTTTLLVGPNSSGEISGAVIWSSDIEASANRRRLAAAGPVGSLLTDGSGAAVAAEI